MAARGLLPLAQTDLLEMLVALRADPNEEIAQAAEATLEAQDAETLVGVASASETPPAVLASLIAFCTAIRSLATPSPIAP